MDTLVYNPFSKEIPEFFGLTQAELVRLKHPTSWLEFETGKISETEYLRRYFTDERRFDQQAFLACVRAAYRWVDGMEELLRELHGAGFEMHTLSNYPPWYKTIEDKLRLSRFVEWTFVSCAAGVRKPAREAYMIAANAVGRAPAECLFIDDSAENCAAAESAGIAAVQFQGVGELRRELARLGLLGT
jgi:HAD superfamily hydrolase (TIGR01509 family)